MLGDHVYYWAWREEDNEGFDPSGIREPKWFRVFRATNTSKGIPLTDVMTKEEAKEYCEQIVKLTDGVGY